MPAPREIDLTMDVAQTNGRSTVEIVRAIADDTTTLFRKEVQLAREEIVEAITSRLKAVAAVAAAAALALVSIVFLGIGAVAALNRSLDAWAAAVIVGGAFLVLAGAGVLLARRFSRPSLVPEETVRTIKEDVEWTLERLKR